MTCSSGPADPADSHWPIVWTLVLSQVSPSIQRNTATRRISKLASIEDQEQEIAMKWFAHRKPLRRRSAPSACIVDSLEQRTLLTSWLPPSGDAQVFLRDGDLIVDNSQGTELFVEGGNIHAQPRSSFTQATVNGGANFSVNLDDFTGDIIVDGYFFYARGFTAPGRIVVQEDTSGFVQIDDCLLYTSPSPRD